MDSNAIEAIFQIFRNRRIGTGESMESAELTPLMNGRQGFFSNDELQKALSEMSEAGFVEISADGSRLTLIGER